MIKINEKLKISTEKQIVINSFVIVNHYSRISFFITLDTSNIQELFFIFFFIYKKDELVA